MARYYDCPICGACEAVTVTWLRDSDGDVMHRRFWNYPEIDDVTCGHTLTAEQGEAILDDAAKDGPPEDDFVWGED